MVQNIGITTNENLFWGAFSSLLGEKILNLKNEFSRFYTNEFHNVKIATKANKFASEAMHEAHQKANKVILATNPVFPLCAVESRLSWIGLRISDFDFVTTYENSLYCKPNPNYYREIIKIYNARPANCLMIRNNVEEDGDASTKAGMNAFIVLDHLISRKEGHLDIKNGSFKVWMSTLESFS